MSKQLPDMYIAKDIQELTIAESTAEIRAGRTLTIEETLTADEMASTLNEDEYYAARINSEIYIVRVPCGFAFAY